MALDTQIVLVRHGQTEWSRNGQHTGRTNIGLTEHGRQEARLVGPTLRNWTFAHNFSSPLRRALETAELANLSEGLIIDDRLMEWDYGVYEGRRTVDIHSEEPGWSKWDQSIEGGENVADVGARADAVIETLTRATDDGPVVIFAHGHFLAILIARWLGLDPSEGRRFVLETSTVSVLGVKRTDRVLRLLNHHCGSETIDVD